MTLLAGVLAACAGAPATTSAPATTATTGPHGSTHPAQGPTTSTTLATGDLSRPEVREIAVDGEPLLVAWADDVAERSRGLRGVDDLGDLDGMLFDMVADSTTTFTMRGTLIPLDIYFFDASGRGLGRLEMVPCDSADCPSYGIEEAFRYALEVPAGSRRLGPAPRLSFP